MPYRNAARFVSIGISRTVPGEIPPLLSPWFIPLIIAIGGGIFFIWCRFFTPKFKGMYIACGGMEHLLEDYRPFYSNKIMLGKHLDIGLPEGVFVTLRALRGGRCAIRPSDDSEIFINDRKIEKETYLSNNDRIRCGKVEVNFLQREV